MGIFDGLFNGLAGGLVSGVGGVLGNNSASKEAQANRDWQERMSNTSHQREVADLKAAGLNPILSANGSGAAVGSGGVASQVNPFSGVPDAVNSARKIDEVEKKALEIKQREADATIALQDEMKNTEVSKQKLNATQEVLNTEQAGLTRMNSVNAIMSRDNIVKQGNALDASVERDLSQAGFNSAYAAKSMSDKALVDRERRAGEYEEKTQKYTRPIRDVFDTITAPVRGLFHSNYNLNK